MQRVALLLCLACTVTSCAPRHQVNEQCHFDDDCATELVCAASYCRAPCVTDRDCVGGYKCLPSGAPSLRVCLPPQQSQRCQLDTDCTGNLVCLPRGVCGRECLVDLDCQVRNPLTLCEEPTGRCVIPRDASAGDATLDATSPDGAAPDARGPDASAPDATIRDASDAADVPSLDVAPPDASVTTASGMRPIYPPMGAILTGLPSTFDWIETAGSAGTISAIEMQVCADVACATVLNTLSPTALNTATDTSPERGSAAPATRIPARAAYYWRTRYSLRSVVQPWSAAWRFTVRRPPAATHSHANVQGRTYDLNADGFPDAVVGAPAQQTVRVVLGGTLMAIPRTFAVTAASLGFGAVANFGARVRFGGDFDNDGLDDVMVAGDPERVRLLYARPLGALATLTSCCDALNGTASGSGFGAAFAGIGDANADGFDDAAMGFPDATEHGARNYFGPLNARPTLLASSEFTLAARRAGAVIAPVGDINGDHFADFFIGAEGYDQTLAFVLGGDGDPALYMYVAPPTANARFGYAIAGAGDFNGDGFPDVVVGDPVASSIAVEGGPPPTGHVYLIPGGPEGPGTPLLLPPPATPAASYGAAVTSAGDLNGDGYADILASDFTGANLTVHFGGAVPQRSVAQTIVSGFTGGEVALSAGQDYDNDGRTEVLVGNTTGGRLAMVQMVAGRDTAFVTTVRVDAEPSVGAAVASLRPSRARWLALSERFGARW